MLDVIFSSILPVDSTGTLPVREALLCTICALALGAVIAGLYCFRSQTSKSFAVTLALLPAIVQMVILLVNGNLGAGVAVMGAFSLVRFRSAPGSAREICSIFLAMAVGLACGMGYVAIAAVFALLIGAVSLLYTISGFGESSQEERRLKITIPESLDYEGVFDELLSRYASRWELAEVRTASMGSLYRLEYRVVLLPGKPQKNLLDELRQRNGNLEIVCGRPVTSRDDL